MAMLTLLPQPPDTEPEGTCAPAVVALNHWWVRGSRGWHIVDADTGECTCEDYVFRCAFHLGDLCKHAQALARHLEQARQCPTCQGEGVLRPSGLITYILPNGEKDEEALECLVCNGTGKRLPTP